MGPKVVIGQTL